jgi:3-phenylpropionate/trans-cinnamate dioxygenase ferredoxin reductase subunit
MEPERSDSAALLRADATIVIIGGGQAGGWAVQTLRKEGFAGRIVLIGDELHPPHERPPLSKALLAGEVPPESTFLMKPEAFEALALDWRPGARVHRIDRENKQVEIVGQQPIAYDRLILCTGGRARTLPIPGAESPHVYSLRTIAEAAALGRTLQPGKRLVVVGGGWIGLEVAATARKKGVEAIVVEAQKRLCERTVPPEVSERLLALHRSQGTQVLLDSVVVSFTSGTDARPVVELAGGVRLECDAIVVGVGLVPNDELAREAGLACDRGIVVDSRCRTPDPDILAAGDVTVTPNAWAGGPLRLESWQNAQDQGIAAARSALGLDNDYQPLPWFWSDQYDMNLQIYGVPNPSYQTVFRGTPGDRAFTLFYLEGNVIKAALGANVARDLRFARRLIEQRKPVDPQRLGDCSVPMNKI